MKKRQGKCLRDGLKALICICGLFMKHRKMHLKFLIYLKSDVKKGLRGSPFFVRIPLQIKVVILKMLLHQLPQIHLDEAVR